MKSEELKQLIQDIVKQSVELKDKHTWAKDAPVNYVCIFSKNEEHYNNLISAVEEMSYIKIVDNTKMGSIFLLNPIDTIAGKLKLLKIRKSDINRKELGDADFTIDEYFKFKKDYLNKKGWNLIKREDFEMMELKDADFNILCYFSNPTLEDLYNI